MCVRACVCVCVSAHACLWWGAGVVLSFYVPRPPSPEGVTLDGARMHACVRVCMSVHMCVWSHAHVVPQCVLYHNVFLYHNVCVFVPPQCLVQDQSDSALRVPFRNAVVSCPLGIACFLLPKACNDDLLKSGSWPAYPNTMPAPNISNHNCISRCAVCSTTASTTTTASLGAVCSTTATLGVLHACRLPAAGSRQ